MKLAGYFVQLALLAINADSPIENIGDFDLHSVIFCGSQTWRVADSARDVIDLCAARTNCVVMIVTVVQFISSGLVGQLNTSDEPSMAQISQNVVGRLQAN